MKTMIRRKAPFFGCVMAATLSVSGCATDEPFNAPIFNFGKSYTSISSRSVPVPLANETWWQTFDDPVLEELITRSLSGNVDLAIARETVIEAYANLDAVPKFFSLTPSASVRREKNVGAPAETNANGRLNLSWMLDPYGLRRQQIKSASARLEVADSEVDAARLSLLMNMSIAYVDLRYNQRLLQLRKQQLSSRRSAVAQTKQLFESRAATRLDVVRTEALVAETQAQIPMITAEIRSRKYEIAVLAGVVPGQLDINLDHNARQPRPSENLKTGVPSDLLRNRPDLQIAERSYYEAVSKIGIARAELYPSLSLGGMIGYASSGGEEGWEYFFGPSLSLPSLPLGSVRATVKARHAQARRAHESWRSAVLVAHQDVEAALAAYEGSRTAVVQSQRNVRLNREARDLTVDLLKREGATVRELISAEENIADADTTLSNNLRQMALNYIMVNISLGAGSQFGRPQPLEVESVVADASDSVK